MYRQAFDWATEASPGDVLRSRRYYGFRQVLSKRIRLPPRPRFWPEAGCFISDTWYACLQHGTGRRALRCRASPETTNRCSPWRALYNRLPSAPPIWFSQELFQQLMDDAYGGVPEHCRVNRSDVEVDEILFQYGNRVVPKSGVKKLSSIINAAWKAYSDDKLWGKWEHVFVDKERVLRDLVLKNVRAL